MNQIGSKIRQVRESKNMSLQALSDSVNISKSSLSRYENGVTDITVNDLLSISEALNVDIDFFIDKHSDRIEIMYTQDQVNSILKDERERIKSEILKSLEKGEYV